MSPELRDYMKTIGQPLPGGKTDSAPGSAAAAQTQGGPSDDQLDWQQRAGKGVAKSLAGTVTGIPRLANAGIGLFSSSLSNTLGDLAEQIPGVKRMEEFAAEPSDSWAESGGYWGGEAAQLLLGPGGAKATTLETMPKAAKVAKAAEEPALAVFERGKGFAPTGAAAPFRAEETATDVSEVPGKFRKNKGFVRTANQGRELPANMPGEFVTGEGFVKTGAPWKPKSMPRFEGGDLPGQFKKGVGFTGKPAVLGSTAAKIGKGAGLGAVYGAQADPENPGAGGLAGAVTGGVIPGLGSVTSSKFGQWMGGQIARNGVYSAIASVAGLMGVPAHLLWRTGIAEAILFYHSPAGKAINQAGRSGASRLGSLLGKVSPGGAGIAAGSAEGALEGSRPRRRPTETEKEDDDGTAP